MKMSFFPHTESNLIISKQQKILDIYRYDFGLRPDGVYTNDFCGHRKEKLYYIFVSAIDL